ncbi:hypothetical protein STRIP9103_00595 [Streptomyces ipomoeae 91-03]|uniref:Low molecular weight protein antigen 6 PH domain-containing protein n=2 Tax=Streptomyces ipomoeae TaxID=103232 RepID=L1KMN9_9ACTN|nr:hypothetical protein STRIP9103_00595 [Streptomyces ipomoeae 91-03]
MAMNDGIEREYRRRQGVPTAHLTLAAVAVVVTLNALRSMTMPGPRAWEALTVVLWLVIGGRVVLEQWRARTYVTADGVTVRGPLRTRTWAWYDIYGIRVEDSKWGTPRWPAYLYRMDGRRTRLPHFDEQQLADPIAELADLYAVAVRLGLTSVETRPEVEERIQRGARRRTAWQRATVTGVVVAVAMFVLETWMIFTDQPAHSFLLLLCVPLLSVPVLFLLLDRIGEAQAARRSPGRA